MKRTVYFNDGSGVSKKTLEGLYQYNLGELIYVALPSEPDGAVEFHISTSHGSGKAYVLAGVPSQLLNQYYVRIPNECLSNNDCKFNYTIYMYVIYTSTDFGSTQRTVRLEIDMPVTARAKPEDYEYTPHDYANAFTANVGQIKVYAEEASAAAREVRTLTANVIGSDLHTSLCDRGFRPYMYNLIEYDKRYVYANGSVQETDEFVSFMLNIPYIPMVTDGSESSSGSVVLQGMVVYKSGNFVDSLIISDGMDQDFIEMYFAGKEFDSVGFNFRKDRNQIHTANGFADVYVLGRGYWSEQLQVAERAISSLRNSIKDLERRIQALENK